MINIKALAFSMMTVFLVACHASKQGSLETALDTYAQALRHKDQDLATAFVTPEHREAFSANFSIVDRLYISHIEVKTVLPDESKEKAVVSLVLEYFDERGATLVTSKRGFQWAYDEDSKSWRLAEASPFGRPIQ